MTKEILQVTRLKSKDPAEIYNYMSVLYGIALNFGAGSKEYPKSRKVGLSDGNKTELLRIEVNFDEPADPSNLFDPIVRFNILRVEPNDDGEEVPIFRINRNGIMDGEDVFLSDSQFEGFKTTIALLERANSAPY